MVGCVHTVVGKKKFVFQFEYGQKKEISSPSLMFLSSKGEVDMDEPLSHSPEKEQTEFLTIDRDPDVVEPCKFEKYMYYSVFYCVCYEMDISPYILEEQVP